jgi:hypothetical protein
MSKSVVEGVPEIDNDMAASAGMAPSVGFQELKAKMLGGNPVWAAVKGVWMSAGVGMRVAVVAALVLVLLLNPLLLVVALLALLVAAVVAGIRAAAR